MSVHHCLPVVLRAKSVECTVESSQRWLTVLFGRRKAKVSQKAMGILFPALCVSIFRSYWDVSPCLAGSAHTPNENAALCETRACCVCLLSLFVVVVVMHSLLVMEW